MPLYGRADVVEHRLDLGSAGSRARIVSSIVAKRCSVSSMRVPGAPRTCSLMSPASTRGEEVAADDRQERERADDEAEERRRRRARGGASAQREPARRSAVAQPLEAAVERGEDAADDAARRLVRARWCASASPREQVVHHASAPACARGGTTSASRRRRPCASGTKSDFAAPVMNTTGTNTMQMHSVETNAGTAICCAPSRIARTIGFFCAMLRWMFSISTVASSTRMPTASAMPPSVMTLSVCPSAREHDDRDQDRQRDRDDDDQRAAPAARGTAGSSAR